MIWPKTLIKPEVKEPPKPVLKKFTAKLELSNTNHGLQAVDGDEKTAVWEQLKVSLRWKKCIF